MLRETGLAAKWPTVSGAASHHLYSQLVVFIQGILFNHQTMYKKSSHAKLVLVAKKVPLIIIGRGVSGQLVVVDLRW